MAVLSLKMNHAGTNNQVLPQVGQMLTNDASSAVTAAGYINPIVVAESIAVNTGDFIMGANSDASHIYTVSVASTGIITLSQLV